MRVLVAPDKFKGSLNAAEAASAIARGVLSEDASSLVIKTPIADGGEGFTEALARRWTTVPVHDPLGRTISARCGWLDDLTAVIAMSEASGLWRLTPNERDPLRANTFGTGELIFDAMERGARKILVGLGGSATNDGGIGMAAALGYEFVTSDGEPIMPVPANLLSLIRIKPPARAMDWPQIIAACDVQNPLLGAQGASRVYGPQKGADERAVGVLELSLENLADIVAADLECDFRAIAGAGAAGGLGFGLMSFCGATMCSGFDLVAAELRLDEAVAVRDIGFTGEGRIDTQTLEGKGPMGVSKLARKHGKPVVAFAGQIEHSSRLASAFDEVIVISAPDMSSEVAMRDAAPLLEQAAARVTREILAGKLLSGAARLSS